MSTFSERYAKNPEEQLPKIIFAISFFVLYLLVVVITHFVIMYKGWGLSVQSWGWMIFLWLTAGLVGGIKQTIHSAINKSEKD